MHMVPLHKQYALNIVNILLFAGSATAPLLGGIFLVLFKDVEVTLGTLNMDNYRILFIISGLMFIFPHLLRKKFRVKEDISTSQVLAIVSRPMRNVFGSFLKINNYRFDSKKDTKKK